MNTRAANKLKTAARLAGYRSAAAFARSIGAEESTMRSHFNGNRAFSVDDAKRYAAKINQSLPAEEPRITWQWLLDGDDLGSPHSPPEPQPQEEVAQSHLAPATPHDTEDDRLLLEKTIIDVRTVFRAAGIDNPELESKAVSELLNERRGLKPR